MATWAFIELATVLNPDRYNGQGLSENFLASVGSARKIARYLILWVDSEYYVLRNNKNSDRPSAHMISHMAECYLLDVASAIYSGVTTLEDNAGLGYMMASNSDMYWPWLKEMAAKLMKRKGGPTTWTDAMTKAVSDPKNRPAKDVLPINAKVMARTLERHFATPVLARKMDKSWDLMACRNTDEFIGFPENRCEGIIVTPRNKSRSERVSIGKIPYILFPFPSNVFLQI